MYVSLYRKYRPQTFSDMVGQSAAVGVLQESLREGRLGHAYLFSGPRGCGKTSAARLVAKSLNCLNPKDGCEPCGECGNCVGIAAGEHLDVIEIDGASNRGIGEIRDLQSRVNLKPLDPGSSCKVYIIDEVHMLTEQAFNALLKTLEEPPANVVFLLATTEPHKVPVTIRSRCQHIPFHRISISDMVKRLEYVCGSENISFEPEALWELARQADGALRDSLSLAEQAIALGRGALTLASVRDLTGGSNRTELEKWVSDLHDDPARAAAELQTMLSHGISIERLTESLFAVFRDIWMYSEWGESALEALEVSDAESDFLRKESPRWEPEKLRAACMLCNGILPRSRYGMRLEVFAGLIMLQLTDIAEGRLPAQRETVRTSAPLGAPRQLSRPAPAPTPVVRPAPQRAPETPRMAEMPPMDEIPVFDDLPPAEPSVPEPISFAKAETAKYDASELCAALGDGPLSRIISELGDRQLVIAAALLHVEIVRKGDGWDVVSEGLSPSEVCLAAPQNRALLRGAVDKVWGFKKAEPAPERQKTDNTPLVPTPAAPQVPAMEARPDVSRPHPTRTATPAAAQTEPVHAGSADRILKLIGAEILYIDDHNAGDEDGENGEQ